ncbi:hypothetical protein HanRHA438_Chr14g0677991 [Helianthus annuus]|nr:hypothetical protein HanIR_Chr14g0723421 [Helianthus annuus]KAJ0855861.1 hypothetical protein HanRHA438_Chr14g0677991 [Helianthus annuus]
MKISPRRDLIQKSNKCPRRDNITINKKQNNPLFLLPLDKVGEAIHEANMPLLVLLGLLLNLIQPLQDFLILLLQLLGRRWLIRRILITVNWVVSWRHRRVSRRIKVVILRSRKIWVMSSIAQWISRRVSIRIVPGRTWVRRNWVIKSHRRHRWCIRSLRRISLRCRI